MDLEFWIYILAGLVGFAGFAKLFTIYQPPQITWMRFIYENEWMRVEGPWVRHNQEKIDAVFEMYDELSKREIDFVQVNDKQGNETLIPGPVIAQTTATIETKNRYF